MQTQQLIEKLLDSTLSHQQRLSIGKRLEANGDIRSGVGLHNNNMPDIDWCAVPAGTMQFENQLFEIQAFHIAKYHVTFTQYQAFIDADDGYNHMQWWLDMPAEHQQQALLKQKYIGENNPRDSLSWYQALAFTRWMNAHHTYDDNWHIRLPYEWEWQWVAQAYHDNRTFAFGDWQENMANTEEAQTNQPIAVGMYPNGQALCGAMDITGNIWEWCLNDYEHLNKTDVLHQTKKVRRGGSFKFNKNFAHNTFRDIVAPSTRSSFNGMRLVLAPI